MCHFRCEVRKFDSENVIEIAELLPAGIFHDEAASLSSSIVQALLTPICSDCQDLRDHTHSVSGERKR
jgi:hypothetical protein